MAHLTAIPSEALLELLKNKTLDQVSKFALIGHRELNINALDLAIDKEGVKIGDIDSYIYFEGDISSAYFDSSGVLTFDVMLNADDEFDRYNYAVALITKDDKLATLTKTPKFILAKGIGGVFCVKVAITGEAGTIVYKNTDYLTIHELKEVHFGTAVDFVNQMGVENISCDHSLGTKDDLIDELDG